MINNTSTVKKQYENSNNLNTRISIHDKYSTNKIGFGRWIVSNYKIEPGMKILELGCGTGSMWKGQNSIINSCHIIILSDCSEGMVQSAKENLVEYEKIRYEVIDIQKIPYDDKTFDVVIANMMLYHVPDLNKALAEVRRVLRDNGTFYCATYGENGIIKYLSELLLPYGLYDNQNKNFTLQNGDKILSRYFERIRKLEYEDSLAVTDINDIIDYIYSLSDMTELSAEPREEIKEILLENMTNGVLNIPKEYGMFVSQ